MIEQDIFNFIKDNLTLSIDEGSGRDYGRSGGGMGSYRTFSVKLKVMNPKTMEYEVLSSESFSIDLE